MRAVLFLALQSGLAVAAGCDVAPVHLTEVASAVECDITRCGTNSPVIDSLRFHELNLDHLENEQHLQLVRFEDSSHTEYTLHVVNGYILGTRSGAPALAGTALTGARIILADTTGMIPGEIVITIQEVLPLHYWARLPGSDPPPMESYNLQYTANGKQGPVCGNPADSEIGLLGMVRMTAVVFEGERIKPATMTVSPTIEKAWVNIGCAGHAIAKLALTGHTEAARSVGFDTTTDERQAMLKMLVGDYCGDGTPFTIAGEPLYWQDHRNWMTFDRMPPVMSTVEARWTAAGAACLGNARLDIHPPVPPASWPSGLRAPAYLAIRKRCPQLPLCEDKDVRNLDGAHLVSGNPDP